MSNRRKFLKNTGAFALGSFLIPIACTSPQGESTGSTSDTTGVDQSGSAAGNVGPFGLQLYSIRDVLEQDLKGNMQKLAEMGYKEVESYPGKDGHYYGMSPMDFSNMLKDAGLTLVSSHFGSGTKGGESVSWERASLTQNFDALVEQAAKTGQRYLTCSSLHESLRSTPEEIKNTATLFNQAGEKCRDAGMVFAYHNHAFEFDKVGDIVLYDYLLENTDPELVKFELDMYWVVRGNQDIKGYLNKYPNRFPLGHVKDMSKEDESQNAVLGTGTIDYADILKTAKKQGMKHFFVEQETYTMSSMDSMKANAEYLSSIKI